MSITTNTPAVTVQTPLQSATGNLQAEYLLNVVLSPAAVAANTTVEQAFTVNGILAGDFIEVNKPALQAGLGIINTRAAFNTLYIGFANTTAGSITPTVSEAYQVCISRPIAQEVVNGLPSSLPLP
jgi:hypothetical protein